MLAANLLPRTLLLQLLILYWLTHCSTAQIRNMPRDAADLEPKRSKLLYKQHTGRIINGTAAKLVHTKHQISLRRRSKDAHFFGSGHICGGSLIRPSIVLSAAHCFVDQVLIDGTFLPKTDFLVVMGTLNRFRRTKNTLTFGLVHLQLPLVKFELSTYDQDVALLFLNGTVPQHHATVQPIKLMEQFTAAGTVCQVTGWGRTERGHNSDILLSADIPIISDYDCKHKADFAESLIKKGMICAGYLETADRDSCSGDSGGPLVCNQQLAGIVSWGIKCGMPWLPGVYTDVHYYLPWINENVKKYEYLSSKLPNSEHYNAEDDNAEIASGKNKTNVLTSEDSEYFVSTSSAKNFGLANYENNFICIFLMFINFLIH